MVYFHLIDAYLEAVVFVTIAFLLNIILNRLILHPDGLRGIIGKVDGFETENCIQKLLMQKCREPA